MMAWKTSDCPGIKHSIPKSEVSQVYARIIVKQWENIRMGNQFTYFAVTTGLGVNEVDEYVSFKFLA